jgi:two-component system response regulator PhoP
MNVLVVDDNRLLNRFLVTFMREKGHQCAALSDALKVEGWLASHPCDAVILDIGLPQIDGITLISRIRRDHQAMPIMILTGMGYDEDLMRRAREAGANDYVSKGLGPAEIYAALMRMIRPSYPAPRSKPARRA